MAVIGVTAKLEYEDGSAWTEVANCKSISFPAFAVTSVDTTHLGISDYGKTFQPGMIDAGAVSFEAEYSETTWTALHGLLRDLIGWRVTGPTGADVVVTCDGFLTSLTTAMTPDEEVMIAGEIKMTGVPVVS